MPAFFFNDTATTEIYTLSLHDALPISPVLDFGEEGIVHRCRAFLESALLGVLVEGALEHGIAREHSDDLVPLLFVVIVRKIADAGGRGLVSFLRLDAGVVDRELFEVSEDARSEERRVGKEC